MSSTYSAEDRPIAATKLPKRSVRGLALVAAVATLSGVMLASGAGSASALPPQCFTFQREVTSAVQQMNYWSQRFDDDLDDGNGADWASDLASYDYAKLNVANAESMARAFGC